MSDHPRNTSGLKPFEPGQSGNPGGKTSQQRADEVKAAEIAARMRLKMLEALEQENSGLDRLDANTLKLFKDSEDRAHGTPKQSLDIENTDGSLTTIDPDKLNTSQKKALLAALKDNEPDANAG